MPPDLARLYDEHAQALFALAINVIRCEADAREIIQEVFGQLAGCPDLLVGVRDGRAFLLRLTHNRAVDFVRRRATRAKVADTLAGDQEPVFAPTTLADEAQFRRALAAALAELPAEQRAVLHLKLWEGATFAETAAILEISPGTAASRYRLGIDKLQARLRPLYKEITRP